jgi:hypothetical protein
MSDHTDIAVRTQRFRDAVRAFTPPPPKRYAKLMPLKEGIVELCKGRISAADSRIIRNRRCVGEHRHDRAFSRRSEWRKNEAASGDTIRTNTQRCPRTNAEQNSAFAAVNEPPPAGQQTVSPQQTVAPSERSRIRGPRIADPRNL